MNNTNTSAAPKTFAIITINGRQYEATNALSSGPGCEAHTYELRGGDYVYRVADTWWLQQRGQWKRAVEVAR